LVLTPASCSLTNATIPPLKELLAVFECVKRFKFLLYGRQSIIAFTDHISLCFPDGVKEDQSRTEHHWWVTIQHFPILLVHIPGKENVLADYLSRDLYPDEMEKPKALSTRNTTNHN
jgi:hypothetical protein